MNSPNIKKILKRKNMNIKIYVDDLLNSHEFYGTLIKKLYNILLDDENKLKVLFCVKIYSLFFFRLLL